MFKLLFNKMTLHDVKYFQYILNSMLIDSRISDMQSYTQHGNTSCLLHCIAVAYISYKIACMIKFSKCRKNDVIRGAMLHDYFLYDWHEKDRSHKWHGFSHPKKALKNARQDFTLSDVEEDIIKQHMFPLTVMPPKKKETYIVSMVDKVCSVYESFSKSPYNIKVIQEAYSHATNENQA